MSVINKSEAEIEIVNRYLNKEINLLEKEMALNIVLACNNPSNKHIAEEIASFANMTFDMPAKRLVDMIIGFGREVYNSNSFNQEEMEKNGITRFKTTSRI